MEELVQQHKNHRVKLSIKVIYKAYHWTHTKIVHQFIKIFLNLTENGASIAVLSSIQTGYGNSARTGKYCRAQEFYKDEETNILSGGI